MFEQAPRRTRLQRQRLAFGNVPIPGTKAGAVVSVGLVVVAWIAVPLARPFILGTSDSARFSDGSCGGCTAGNDE